ncbi:MAG: ABC transporter substrate-binding protein [Clostridia bacterium]|jgi:iron complex transport system substrate-binding protein|nr:ABC transporter substrate-binding protein [Clostridia bacterium]
MKNILKRAVMLIIAGSMLGLTACASKSADNTDNASSALSSASVSSASEDVSSSEPSTTVFVDDIGREVELTLPITRACVANRYNNELIRAVGAGDNVVGVDVYTSQDSVYWPNFGEDETFGKNDYDYEKIVSLKPQVLVMPKNGKVDEAIAKLKPFGIKVVVITGWDNSDVPKQIKLCGTLFGKEEKADELTAFYQKTVDYIQTQLKQVKEKKTVYWEYGSDYTTCIPGTSNDGWNSMISMAGGINIFGDASLAGKDIDPEQILVSDPDLIVKVYSGDVVGNSGIFTAPSQEEFAAKAQQMLQRDGWKDLKAVKNGNFYLNTAFMSGGLGKMIGAAYIAKWLYPELMTDLDPDAIFKQWMEYQGFEPNASHYYHVPAQQ